jgi:hypothetical protein
MIKFDHVSEKSVVFLIDGCEDYIFLTPLETYQSHDELSKGIFAWHKLTGKTIDEGHPH